MIGVTHRLEVQKAPPSLDGWVPVPLTPRCQKSLLPSVEQEENHPRPHTCAHSTHKCTMRMHSTQRNAMHNKDTHIDRPAPPHPLLRQPVASTGGPSILRMPTLSPRSGPSPAASWRWLWSAPGYPAQFARILPLCEVFRGSLCAEIPPVDQ